MLKVQKHIIECQNEVKTNIFNEAFSLINDHAFHHPDDHGAIHLPGHDDFAHRNFTLTEQEILKFFESHEHPHPKHGAASQLSLGGGSLGSSVELLHENDHDESDEHDHPPNDYPVHDHPIHDHSSHEYPIHDHSIHDHPIHNNPTHDHPVHNHAIHNRPSLDQIVHHPNPHPYAWQQPYPIESFYKKTDAVDLNNKPDEAQRLMRALTANRNPYEYFNAKTGEPVKTGGDRPRRSVHELEFHVDPHPHPDEIHNIHPTTASFKDKRIAGVSGNCTIFFFLK